jgi:hypothetical protein
VNTLAELYSLRIHEHTIHSQQQRADELRLSVVVMPLLLSLIKIIHERSATHPLKLIEKKEYLQAEFQVMILAISDPLVLYPPYQQPFEHELQRDLSTSSESEEVSIAQLVGRQTNSSFSLLTNGVHFTSKAIYLTLMSIKGSHSRFARTKQKFGERITEV